MAALCKSDDDGFTPSENNIFKKEEEQTVEISISQYTDWLLKAHTITQIQKLYRELDDYNAFTDAVGALIEN